MHGRVNVLTATQKKTLQLTHCLVMRQLRRVHNVTDVHLRSCNGVVLKVRTLGRRHRHGGRITTGAAAELKRTTMLYRRLILQLCYTCTTMANAL